MSCGLPAGNTSPTYKTLQTMRRNLISILAMLLSLSINAAGVNLKDIIGNWKHVPEKGVVMAGEIVMNISATSISQSLYSKKNNSKSDIFFSSYYLSDVPATFWNNDMVGKAQSGSYLVRKGNTSLSQSEISFDGEGRLVLVPYNSERGVTMRFRRMSGEENDSVRNSEIGDELGIMAGYIELKNREKNVPLLEVMSPGTLAIQIGFFAAKMKAEALTMLRIGGPMNAFDLITIRHLDDYFPNINSLDLYQAWFVTDSLAYYSHEYENKSHGHFSGIRGLHMVKDFNKSALALIYDKYNGAAYDACYDRYGWLVEEKKDEAYRHFCTTIDDCVSELAFFGVPWLRRIILPMSTKEIHWQAFSYCPQLQEVNIPAEVKTIGNYAFAGDTALTVIRVAEDSPLLSVLKADLHSAEPKLFTNPNPNLTIETYSNKQPEVTFTIRGRKKAGKYPVMVSDYTKPRLIRKLDGAAEEFSFSVTVPQYSIIGFNNLNKAVIAEGADVYIDLTNDSLSGTPLNDKLHGYNRVLSQCEKELRNAQVELDWFANEDSIAARKARLDKVRSKLFGYISRFSLSNYDNCISAYMVKRYYDFMPHKMIKMLFMAGAPSVLRDPLLRNQWEWLRESSRTAHIDYHGYGDTRFMTSLTNVKGGELKTLQTKDEWEENTRLKIDGPLNADDISWLRELCRNYYLQALDLSDAYIVDAKGQNSAYMPDSSFAFNRWLKYIVLPKSIKVIGQECFYDCNGLEFVKMYDGVHTIGLRAFANSGSLHDFALPASLERIGREAFWQCSDIHKMILPEKVKEIGANAFGRCRNLTKLHIPAATEKISDGITYNSVNVTVTIDEANKNYKTVLNAIIGLTKEACNACGQRYPFK